MDERVDIFTISKQMKNLHVRQKRKKERKKESTSKTKEKNRNYDTFTNKIRH